MAAILENRLLARLLATARTVTALEAINPVRDAGAEGSQWLRAKVAAQLADGSFRVLIGGKPLKLALPAGTRPGDTITLRPPLPGSLATLPSAASESTAGLSATGRLIAALLGAATQAAPVASRPLLEAPPQTAAALPVPLARGIEASGLFYESHQARWAEGHYPLPRLQQEPQARLARSRAASPAETPTPASAADVRIDVPAAQPPQQTEEAAQDGTSERAFVLQSGHTGASEETPAQTLSTEHAALVRQQLEMLAGRPLAWAGELWPGQPARWEIDAAERDAHEHDEPAEWTSAVTLTMPVLGAVGARLTMSATRVRVQLEVDAAHTLRVVRAALPQLAQALALTGMDNPQLEATQRVARS
jgi:hypothetical protein